jgi:hypothetical protein
MTTHADITDPIDYAATCITAANIHADRAAERRAEGDHSAAGIDREQQRYYMKRAEVHLAQSQAVSMQRIADALDRLALLR